MAFKPADCPSCGGSLQIPDDKDIVKCMYCGDTIVVREVLKIENHANLENLFRLADSAAEANNNEEAYNYYTQILEYDGQNPKAWFGKGVAAGWMSTLVQFKISEVISCLKNSIKFTKEQEIVATQQNAADKINSISTALYNLSKQHLDEFASIENTWTNHVNQCTEIISALEIAYELNPSEKQIIKNIIFVCSGNIEGVSFYDEIYQYSDVLNVTEEYERILKGKIKKYESILKGLDPNYVAPAIEKASKTCFVVTATMGDSNHPNVVLLRNFRDSQLLKYNFGKTFISWYNKKGPIYATMIEKSSLLKIASYYLIVLPSSSIIRVFHNISAVVKRN